MRNTFGVSIIPDNEKERLQNLYHYQIIEADVKDSFDNIAQIAACAFDVPIALVSLVDKEQVIFKGNVGMNGVSKKSRGISLCALAVLSDEVTVFENADNEPCLVANPLIAGDFGLKFYAGAPLTTKEGHHIGTLCIVDKKPRLFSEAQKVQLKRFAKLVMNEIEIRLEANKAAFTYSETIEEQRNNLVTRELQLSMAQQIARIASWEWTISESEIIWSPEMYAFWGFEEGEISVTLDKVAQMTHPDDIGILQKAVESVMKGEDIEIEYRRYDKDGNEIFIHTKAIVKTDSSGKPLSVFGIDMDITILKAIQDDLKAQNEKLVQANTELASFNFIASHDLKEPLRKIQTFSNRITEYEGDNLSEKAKYYFSRIVDAAKRMDQLIDSLMVFSKVSNISDIKFKKVDLNEILSNVTAFYKEAIDAQNVEIIASSLPTIKGLPEQIEQVFSNLINNSIKYSKEGITPKINIKAEKTTGDCIGSEHKGFWKIEFQDNGIGFEPIYEEKIFEVFQRLNSKSKYDGTGIGLAICKKIMKKHNGDIKATGKLDEGTIFTLYFPI